MSHRSSSSSENAFDFEELSEFRKELRKEKDMLKDSQSQSFELIRGLEKHVKTLSQSRTEDKRRIHELERELKNSLQEIDYLQDQLNARNTEVYNLHLKLADMENLEEEVVTLQEQLKRSDSEQQFLMHELEKKNKELDDSSLCIEKLEESVSSTGLEYHCEIESLKLDLMTLEQSLFELEKSKAETSKENARICALIQDLELQIRESEKVIECLDKKNKDLMLKLETSEMTEKLICGRVQESLHEWPNEADQSSSDLERDQRSCSGVLGPLHSKIVSQGVPDADLEDHMDKMSSQIHDYELLVSQLKEELKQERLKAKEEAEDLAQEMAELRYQMTELLEEERKRRACVEQVALQRIAELEGQLGRQRNPIQDQRKLITGDDQTNIA